MMTQLHLKTILREWTSKKFILNMEEKMHMEYTDKELLSIGTLLNYGAQGIYLERVGSHIRFYVIGMEDEMFLNVCGELYDVINDDFSITEVEENSPELKKFLNTREVINVKAR